MFFGDGFRRQRDRARLRGRLAVTTHGREKVTGPAESTHKYKRERDKGEDEVSTGCLHSGIPSGSS